MASPASLLPAFPRQSRGLEHDLAEEARAEERLLSELASPRAQRFDLPETSIREVVDP